MADIYLKIINGSNVLNISIMKLRFPRSGKARFCIAVFPISVLATMAEWNFENFVFPGYY